MGRSVKKGPYVDPKLMARIMAQKEKGTKEEIKTWSRASTVVPQFVGHTILVHKGKGFQKVFITEDMVGHKLGEFAPTRTFRGHTAKKKKGK